MLALTSLVIPVFNEADSIEPLVAEIDAALGAAGLAFEVVFVDDGSTDGSFAAMERLAAARDDVRVVKLRRNFGKAAALAHGIETERGDYVDTLDFYCEHHRYIPVVAAHAGFRVTEEPVSHRPRTAGKSKYGWQRYLRGYLDLLTVLFLGRYQHRPQHLFGGIGTLLILIGVLVELYLSVDKLVYGNPIGQRPLLLLGALLIIVGVQLLSLGLIGELIANSRARGGPDDAQVALVVGAGGAGATAPGAPAARGAAAPQDAAVAPAPVAPGAADEP